VDRLVGQTTGLAAERARRADTLRLRRPGPHDGGDRALETRATRTTTFFDAADNPVQVFSPAGWVTLSSYDALNQLLTRTEAATTPVERTATFAYDAVGNLVGQTTGLAPNHEHKQVTRFVYDALDRRIATVEADHLDALRRSTTVTYDARNNVLALQSPSHIPARPFRLDVFELMALNRRTPASRIRKAGHAAAARPTTEPGRCCR
jgi:YD repeat-containing protein